MIYAVYTRSRPQDTDCKADDEQYRRCLAFAARYRLGYVLPHYSDTLVLSADGEVKGLQNLFADIRSGQIQGILVEDVSFLGETAARLVRVMDFFAVHQTRILVVKETVPCLIP